MTAGLYGSMLTMCFLAEPVENVVMSVLVL